MKLKTFEEKLELILGSIFFSSPLENIKIGEVRPKLEWQKKEIKKLINSLLDELEIPLARFGSNVLIEGQTMIPYEQQETYYKGYSQAAGENMEKIKSLRELLK